MPLAREVLKNLKGRGEAWKGALESKGLTVNVKKTKMMISSENAGNATIACAVCRKGVGSNFTLCQFCRHWVHERCSGIR